MNDHFLWNGVNCKTLGITATELPEITFPAERLTFTNIPGRSGALTTREGADVYDDITLSCTCYVRDTNNVDAIGEYLRGTGIVEFPNRPNGYYEATIINQIPFAKVLRGNTPRSFAVNFRCKPMFHLDEGDEQTTITSGQFIENPTGFVAHPEITITGNGNINLIVGSNIIELANISGGIILDSEMQEAYYENTLQNSKMKGKFPVLGKGSTAISWSGGTVSSVKIRPRWVAR